MVVILLFHKHSLLRLLPGRGGVLEVSCRAVRLNETGIYDFCEERSEAVGF